MSRAKPCCIEVVAFLKHHCGKNSLGALTGQDARALQAFRHLVDLYAVSDATGREATLRAMSATVQAAQMSVWPLFKKCIPAGLDWTDEDRIWQEITA